MLGLSKVARLAKMFARRMQNQQRFTQQLLEAFNAEVQPLGCAAIVEAVHLGRQHTSQTSITAASFGCFYAQPDNFMQVIDPRQIVLRCLEPLVGGMKMPVGNSLDSILVCLRLSKAESSKAKFTENTFL